MGTPMREIERKLGISRTSLRPYRDRAEASGKTMEELLRLEDAELHAILSKEDVHRNRGVCAGDDPQVYDLRGLVHRHIPQGNGQSVRVYSVQGPASGVDSLWVTDTETGECLKATVLVCVLPFSMMSFAIAMPSATMENLFNALGKALAYFGGVAEISKTDNMTQWVKKYNRYEPALNEAAQQWAMHNGTDISGCRVRKPRDKGPAEGLVDKVYKVYYSRVYNETWTSFNQLNARLLELNDFFNDIVPKGHTHSVPYQYIGKKAKVVFDAETVEVWCEMKRITTHDRMHHDGYSTKPEHMPERHRAYAESKEYNAAYFQKKASQVGPETRAVIDAVLDRPYFVQQSYRACQGILGAGLQAHRAEGCGKLPYG